MAVVKTNYVKQNGREKANTKATIRYIQNRPGQDKERLSRVLFGNDGMMERKDAYRMVDEAPPGSVFWRIMFSPDPNGEDEPRDLNLPEAAEKMIMLTFGVRLHKQVQWVAAVHADHRPHRHVHIVAIVPGKLSRHDFAALPQVLRYEATQACLEQRRELDLTRDLTQEPEMQQGKEGPEWERERLK